MSNKRLELEKKQENDMKRETGSVSVCECCPVSKFNEL